jgi:hypothetical protein
MRSNGDRFGLAFATLLAASLGCRATDLNASATYDAGQRSDDGLILAESGADHTVVMLASGQQSPTVLAIDRTNVYWLNQGTSTPYGKGDWFWNGDGQVMKRPIAGGAPVVLAAGRALVGPTYGIAALATDGVNVYWADVSADAGYEARIQRCSVDGCDNTPEPFTQAPAIALAADGSQIYWTEFSATVQACPVAGCGSRSIVLWGAGNAPCATGLAVDADDAYWGTVAPVLLMKCTKSGCANSPTTLTSVTTGPITQVAVDADSVYFNDGNPIGLGKILKCAKAGCPTGATVLADGLDSPSSVATDGVSIYWAERNSNTSGPGRVRKCAVGGCSNAPTDIATGLSTPVSIAVDDRYVYWVEAGDMNGANGRVCMAPK